MIASCVIALIWAAAGFINNLSGFGAAMVALPLMAFYGLDMKTAAPATLIVACLWYLQLCRHCRRGIDLSRIWPVALGLVPGAFLGVLFVTRVGGETLRLWVGGVIILYSLWGVFVEGRATHVLPRLWGIPVGLASSFLGAAVGFPGPPLIFYAALSGWTKESMKAGLAVFFILSTSFAMVAQCLAGGIQSAQTLQLAALGVPGSLAGGFLGILVSRRVGEYSFRKLTYALLLCMGIGILP